MTIASLDHYQSPQHRYESHHCLYETNCLAVYRAKRADQADAEQSYILKVVDKERCEIDTIEQLHNEYAILQQLPQIAGLPQVIEFFETSNHWVLALSDFKGITLSQAIDQLHLSTEQIVDALCQCTRILDALHNQHIIHKDVKPSNIIWNPESEQVQLIDFGLAVLFDHSLNHFYQFGSMDGSLCYMPPEQTGRVNRQVDYRSDYYSLGMTAYELLCQEKPFTWYADSDEILYAILAIEPPAPKQINAKIPVPLSDIIMRLIAKDAEDRYQTNKGLLHDLSNCLSGDPLTLGEQDIRAQFQIPNKLYGRDDEIATLQQALNNVTSGHSERVYISGFSGVGKTRLVREIYGDIQRNNGYVIEGKFDQLQRNQPLFALTQAFNDFFASILVESDRSIQCWQQNLKDQLGENIGVLTRLIPNLDYLVEDNTSLLYLSGEEVQNRLVYAFLNLIKVIATPEKPLVMFIDDLQWMDLASIKLLDALFRAKDIKHVLFIGAYRENEMDPSHPAMALITQQQESYWQSQALPLSNLSMTATQEIIEEGFQQRILAPDVLTHYLHKKTAGNPFFILQLIDNLLTEQLIQLSEQNQWQYQIKDIDQLAIADSVVSLMLDKLSALPADQRALLHTAAAIGHDFDIKTLALISDKTKSEVKALLLPTIHSGFVLAHEQHFSFAHDGIQQAAYELATPEHRRDLHYKIGNHLYQSNRDNKSLERDVFDICFHLNQCRDCLIEPKQQLELIELNLMAAKMARLSAAYKIAQQHVDALQELLRVWPQHNNTSLQFNVTKEAAECAYLCGQFDTAETHFKQGLTLASNNLEHCQISNLYVILLIALGRYEQSFELGINALKRYQIELPSIDDDADIEGAYQTKLTHFEHTWLKADKRIADLYQLPVNSDPEIHLQMELLGSLYASALMSYTSYQKVLTMELVNLSIQHGNTKISPIAYAWHGSTITAISEEFNLAWQFGQVAIRLNEQKIHNSAIACKLYNMVANFISPFNSPLKECLPSLRQAYSLGLESGDKLYASYSIINELRTALSTGMPLHKWLALDDEVTQKLLQCDGHLMVEVRESFRSYAIQLAGKSHDWHSLDNDDFCEADYREKYREVPLFGCLLDAWKIQSCFHLGQFDRALELGQKDSSPIDSFVLGVEKHLFAALTALHFIDAEPNSDDVPQWQQVVAQTIKRITPLAASCPENYLHLLALLQGAQFCVNGEYRSALRSFNQAIQSAKQNGFVQYQALGNELAAKTSLKDHMPESANVHLEQAFKLFSNWGAVAKLEQLKRQYPDVNFYRTERSASDSRSRYIDKSVIDQRIDLKSIMETSLALSSEIEIDLVISRMMKVVLASSGAQRALLLVESNYKWCISAEITSDESYTYHTPKEALAPDEKMPLSVLQYVLRTGKTLHLNDAVNTAIYTTDDYIQTHNAKSLICLPLRHRGKTKAILYLENNLATDLFTKEQFQRLTLLSSQMASAIDHSLNYQSLADSERHYRSLLKNLPTAILVQQQDRLINYANENAHEFLSFISTQVDDVDYHTVSGEFFDNKGRPFTRKDNPIEKVFASEKPQVNIEIAYRAPDSNALRWFIASAFPQYSHHSLSSVVTCLIDITERKEHEAKIEHLAYYDSLTGLPNRVSLENKLTSLVSQVKTEQQYAAVLMLDLDNFKLINDSLGHGVGDEVLRQVAKTLNTTIEPGDFIARLGGDEFIIVTAPFCQSRATGILKVEQLAQQIKHVFEQKFRVNGRELNSGASIGAVLIPGDGDTVDEILRRVDAALYESKRAGRNTLSFFQMEQENQMQRRFELEEDLRTSIDKEQFTLLYQPKVNVKTGQIIGAEALVRWIHPTLGFISPAEFIPIAEESGLIVPLGEWILAEACRQAQAWLAIPGFEHFARMSVNVSSVQFNHEHFLQVVKQTLSNTHLSPNKLDLEITESLLLANTEVIIEKMTQLKAMGLSFSIDDFGTGYSSLEYLKRLPVDTIKIDQSFVRDMNTVADDKAIVETVIAIATSLRLNTVAEGVETIENLDVLQDMGCHEYQGYYFSRPLPADEFVALVSDKAKTCEELAEPS